MHSSGAIDQFLNTYFAPFADFLSAIVFFAPTIAGVEVPIIVLWLVAAAIFLTVWLRFQPITGLAHSIDVIRGKFTRKTDPGEVSSFQALATELSGTVGLGNIAGVAVAISIGGPGAALWIVIFGFLAMSVKMAEATLGVKYREIDDDGHTHGGPMYYLKHGLADIGFKKFGIVLSFMYAIFTLIGVFGAGNLFQSNQGAAILSDQLGIAFLQDNRWVIGAIMAALAALVIVGGIQSIGTWTARITPLMAIVYFLCVLAIIIMNIQAVPEAVVKIITTATTGEGVTGGAIGVAITGIQRALFSNAAGVGSAGMAHSASKTKEPATEGFTAMWEPLVDSVIVCTLTAIAITVTGVYTDSSGDGIVMTASAFGTVASWFPYILTVAVALFAFSTILSYYYYGNLAAEFLFGRSAFVKRAFQVVWILAVILGSAVSMDAVINFSDAVFFLMTIPNLLGIYFLAKVVRYEILRHKVKLETGAIAVVHPDLAVGMGDHEPTEEQVAEARALEEQEQADYEALKQRLADDPDWPHRED